MSSYIPCLKVVFFTFDVSLRLCVEIFLKNRFIPTTYVDFYLENLIIIL